MLLSGSRGTSGRSPPIQVLVLSPGRVHMLTHPAHTWPEVKNADSEAILAQSGGVDCMATQKVRGSSLNVNGRGAARGPIWTFKRPTTQRRRRSHTFLTIVNSFMDQYLAGYR